MTRELAIRSYRTMYRYMSEHYTEYLSDVRKMVECDGSYDDVFFHLKSFVYHDMVEKGILERVPFIEHSYCYLCAYVDYNGGLKSLFACDDYCPILFQIVHTSRGELNDCTFHCVTIETFLKLILRTKNPSPYLTAALSRYFAKIAELPERKEKSYGII